MNIEEFAKSIIEGTGGMNCYEDHELVVWHRPDRVEAAIWAIRCLANPDCRGSQEAIDAILERRQRLLREAQARQAAEE